MFPPVGDFQTDTANDRSIEITVRRYLQSADAGDRHIATIGAAALPAERVRNLDVPLSRVKANCFRKEKAGDVIAAGSRFQVR